MAPFISFKVSLESHVWNAFQCWQSCNNCLWGLEQGSGAVHVRQGRGGVGQGRQSAIPLAHPSNLNHLVIVTSSLAASKCNLRVGEGAAGSNRVARGCDSLVTRQQLSTTHVSTPQAGRRQHCHYWCHAEDEGVRVCERVCLGFCVCARVRVCLWLWLCVRRCLSVGREKVERSKPIHLPSPVHPRPYQASTRTRRCFNSSTWW